MDTDFEYLVSGFIHDEEKTLQLSMDIPEEIYAVVLTFYCKLYPNSSKVTKFELFCEDNFRSCLDGSAIIGCGSGCSGYLIFPEIVEPNGYSTGVHYWSVQAAIDSRNDQRCWLSIGIVSSEGKEAHALDEKCDNWPLEWCGDLSVATYFLRNDIDFVWPDGATVTVKLDCDEGVVGFYQNGYCEIMMGEYQSRSAEMEIDRSKTYFFAMTACEAQDTGAYRIVDTPELYGSENDWSLMIESEI